MIAESPLGRPETPYEAWIVPEPPDTLFISRTREELSQARTRALLLIADFKAQQASSGTRISAKASVPGKTGATGSSRRLASGKIIPVRSLGVCSNCGCPYDHFTPGCYSCKNRHYMRNLIALRAEQKALSEISGGTRYIPQPAGQKRDPNACCSRCRILVNDFTKGCKTCLARHASRRHVVRDRRLRYLGIPLYLPPGRPLKRLVAHENCVAIERELQAYFESDTFLRRESVVLGSGR